MEGVIALMIPVLAILGFFSWMIANSAVGKALGERIRHGAGAPAQQEEVLRQLEELRREVAELAERVDFTERLLAKHRAADRLGPAR